MRRTPSWHFRSGPSSREAGPRRVKMTLIIELAFVGVGVGIGIGIALGILNRPFSIPIPTPIPTPSFQAPRSIFVAADGQSALHVRIVLDQTCGAQVMTELGVRVFFEVLFNSLPGFLITENHMTMHADRQYSLQSFDV